MIQQNTVPFVASAARSHSADLPVAPSASESALLAAVAAVTLAAEAAVNAASVASTASNLCTEACASVNASKAYGVKPSLQAPIQQQSAPSAPAPPAKIGKQAEPKNVADALPLILPSEPAYPAPPPSSRSHGPKQRRPNPVVTGEAIPINPAGARPRRANTFKEDTTIFDVIYDVPGRREPEPENRFKLAAFLSLLIFAIVTLAVLFIRA